MSDKHSKIREALLNVKKILQCTVCHKLPTDPVAAKCGHLFCQCCVDKIVNTKRGVCGVCKSILIRSGLNKIGSCKKIVADFKALYEASEKDVNATKQTPRQYPAKHKNFSLREASCGRTDTTKSGTSTIQSLKRKGGRPKKTTANEASLESVETIKFDAKSVKKTDELGNTNVTSPVFTKDELSTEIEAIGSAEKVKGWLYSESFEEKSCHPEDFPEVPARPTSRSSSVSSDLESFSQKVSKSGINSKSTAESAQKEMKERNKAREVTPSAEVFNNIQKEQNTDKEKPKTSSALAESSWSGLEQLKKETRANVRKRKRLNVSIERPSSIKAVVESLDKNDPEDKDDRNPKHNGSDEITDSAKKRLKPNIVSYKTLDESERFDVDVEKLNKRQVKQIIGVVDSDLSKNSTGSLEESVDKSNTPLKKSINNSKNKSNEGEQSRPQSRQSLRQNESRPESRISNRSLGKRASDKFRLSTRISSSTPNASPAKESVEEKIEPVKTTKSPLKTSNDVIRKNLSLRRVSSGSSKTTDRENKGISITKLGKLYKPRKVIKFYYRGSTIDRLARTGSCCQDAQTQTSPDDLNEEAVTRKIGPQTSTSLAAGTSSKIPSEELDTANKVNILSPRDDSQLKYLATESPTVPRISVLNSSRRIGDTSKTTGEISFVSSGVDDFSKKVKRFADKLIVTDSEDQDTPMQDLCVIKRRNIEETEKIESPLAASRKNKVVTNVHDSSPMRKKKLSGSETKRRSTEKPKSESKSGIIGNREKPEAEETEVISKAKSRDDSCQVEDSEPILSNTKHKVVRKLDYSQESGLNCTSHPGKSGSNDKETKRRSPGKKSFKKARLISSSDSDDDLLNISVTTKESSSNSQPVARPGMSQVFGSMILTEDISIAFSSNRETVDTKRKRSPSPHSLDNNDIKAIAAGWCEEMDRSQKENADDNGAVFGRSQDVSKNSPAHKKVKIATKASSLSLDSDQFPILSPTAIYGSRNKPKETDNNRSKSSLSFAGKITPAKNQDAESTVTNSSVKRGNTFNGRVTTSRNTTPIKSRSFEAREARVLSHNSDKENDLGEVSKTTTRGDSINSKEKVAVSHTKESPSNTELFESLNLNITQEQLLMQELEDNLLGRKSNNATQKKSQDNVPVINKERTPSKRVTHNDDKLRPKSYQVAQIESDDSIIMSDEEIIESTPEKNLLSKKDQSTHVDNSQKSNASLKSFMSVDITPIPNRVPKLLQIDSETSPLVERNSRLSTNQENLLARISSHSTPKTVNSKPGTSGVENRKRFCFVCSCLTPAQVHNVKAFARMHNVEYTATYKPEVTHVIVETTESDTAGRTLKYLLGVAHKKWIVSYRWVMDCMSKGKLLPEEKYEAVDSDTEEPGPRRSRLSEKGLFDDFAFVCIEPFSEITVVQLRDLITSCGGIVVGSIDEFANLKGRHKVILYNGDAHQTDVLVNWTSRRLALPVQVEWILACISQYDLMSFRDYLDIILDPELALEMGYPEELIVDEEDSANEASTMIDN